MGIKAISPFGEERIRPFLLTHGGLRPVTWIDNHIVAEGEDLGMDTMDKTLIITTWKVGPANRACKKCIANKYDLVDDQGNGSCRVTRGVVDFQRNIPEGLVPSVWPKYPCKCVYDNAWPSYWEPVSQGWHRTRPLPFC